MLALHTGMRVHLALGATDMRRGFDGLAARVQTVLQADPFSGHPFAVPRQARRSAEDPVAGRPGPDAAGQAPREGPFHLADDRAPGRRDADAGAAGDAAREPGLAHADVELEA
jgi:transposase